MKTIRCLWQTPPLLPVQFFQRFFNIAKCHIAQKEHWHVMEIWQHNGWDFFFVHMRLFKLQREYLNTFSYHAYVLWLFSNFHCAFGYCDYFFPCWAVELSMAWGYCVSEKRSGRTKKGTNGWDVKSLGNFISTSIRVLNKGNAMHCAELQKV